LGVRFHEPLPPDRLAPSHARWSISQGQVLAILLFVSALSLGRALFGIPPLEQCIQLCGVGLVGKSHEVIRIALCPKDFPLDIRSDTVVRKEFPYAVCVIRRNDGVGQTSVDVVV
jgi:hypothetical protein